MNNLAIAAVIAAAMIQAVPWIGMSCLQYAFAYLVFIGFAWCLLEWLEELGRAIKQIRNKKKRRAAHGCKEIF